MTLLLGLNFLITMLNRKVYVDMSFRCIKSSGLLCLSSLRDLEVFKANHNSLNTSSKSLVNFFQNMKNLIIVNISGSSSISREAIATLANNNKNLTHLYLNTYLLPCDAIQIVKEKCPIKIIKFSPEILITR